MTGKFKIFSADWSVDIQSSGPEEAAIAGMNLAMEQRGEHFTVAPIVVCVNRKTGNVQFYESPALLEDMQHFILAGLLKHYIKRNKL